MWSELGVTWPEAGLVVTATVGIYLVFVMLVRLVGPRSLAAMASFDLALVVAIGSILGRTSLLARPSLATGVIAITTMFSMQGLLGTLRKNRRLDRLINGSPVLLVAAHEVVHANLARVHILESELYQKLRLAGIGSLADVQCAVLERTGAISIIKDGVRIDEDIVREIAGTAGLLRHHVATSQPPHGGDRQVQHGAHRDRPIRG